VNEILNGRTSSIRQFSEFFHQPLIELIQWREAPKNEGHDVFQPRFHAVVLCSFAFPGKRISLTIT